MRKWGNRGNRLTKSEISAFWRVEGGVTGGVTSGVTGLIFTRIWNNYTNNWDVIQKITEKR